MPRLLLPKLRNIGRDCLDHRTEYGTRSNRSSPLSRFGQSILQTPKTPGCAICLQQSIIQPLFLEPHLLRRHRRPDLHRRQKKWLTGPEIVLSFFLLAIPYVTRAYEMCMASHARFAAVVFPAYIVLGRLLGAAPAWMTWVVIGAFSIMLMTWTALYAAGHLFF